MRLLRWFFSPPLFLPMLLGLFIATGVLSWRVLVLIAVADTADDAWRSWRTWRQREPSPE